MKTAYISDTHNCCPNETWRDCATCESTCEEHSPICTEECKPAACQCSNGFVRNVNGQCVNATEMSVEQCNLVGLHPGQQCEEALVNCFVPPCPPIPVCVNETQSCGPNEHHVECAAACEPTCNNRCPICTRQCLSARCQCSPGYVRNNNGTCVDWVGKSTDVCNAQSAVNE
ncbi:trypsin inhibitor like cysteine rich domain-containing protein [Ditylenchus destructor]|nr:trypsin inhibitor like cysteine rich domain-containing protein [Ditylenchus destructor]